MESPLILALDIGTSSVRAALYDGNSKSVPRSSVKIEYSFTATARGGFEIDADVLLGHVIDAIDGVLAKTAHIKAEIEHAASCSFWHSLMGIDERGRPTTRVLGWADRQSGEYSAVLKKRFNEPEVHDRTGAHFHSSFWPAKLLWLRGEHKDVFDRTAKWMSFADYVLFHLAGDVSTGISMASASGIFDQRRCEWDSELLKYLKIRRSQLPEIVADASALLSPRSSKRWPRLKHTKWFASIGDGAADHIGSCGIGKDKASLMVGTSAAMRVAFRGEPPRKIPEGLWCYRIDRDCVITGGALSDGGNLHQWVGDNFTVPNNADDEMRRRGAAAHGLTLMPFFFGERSTGYDENARGSIVGLTSSHDSVDILQAAMEAVAYRLTEIHDKLKKIAKVRNIVASGGALRDSPVWTQIVADVLGCDLLITDTRESSMRGTVLLALEKLGKIDAIEKLAARQNDTLTHHPDCHAVYKQAREQHREAYRLLSERNL